MLQKLSKWAVGALVILISVVFVLQFGGPQADGIVSDGLQFAAKVNGDLITAGDFNAAYRLANFDQQPEEQQERYGMRDLVLNGLIETKLLAAEARELGYEVESIDIMRNLAENGRAYLRLGFDAPEGFSPAGGQVQVPVFDRSNRFDEEFARGWIQHRLNRSVSEFSEMQVDYAMAERMIQTVGSTVEISPRELWSAFESEKERAQIKYVRFAPGYYADTLDMEDAALEAWMTSNQEQIDSTYESEQASYTDLEEQVRARHILIRSAESDEEAERASARLRAEGLLAELRAGADFVLLARTHSDDSSNAPRGGDLGWNPRGRMVGPFDEAQFGTPEGTISDVVETRFGFHIIQVVGKREGDVAEADAKREIAERLYRTARGEELAQEAAAAVLAELQGGLSFDDLSDRYTAVEGEEIDWRRRHTAALSVSESRRFGRGDSVLTGPYNSAPLNTAVFAMAEVGDLPEEPMTLGEDVFVFQLAARERANREEFTDDVRQRLAQGMLRSKRREVVRSYISRLVTEAREAGTIRINQPDPQLEDEDEAAAEEEEAS